MSWCVSHNHSPTPAHAPRTCARNRPNSRNHRGLPAARTPHEGTRRSMPCTSLLLLGFILACRPFECCSLLETGARTCVVGWSAWARGGPWSVRGGAHGGGPIGWGRRGGVACGLGHPGGFRRSSARAGEAAHASIAPEATWCATFQLSSASKRLSLLAPRMSFVEMDSRQASGTGGATLCSAGASERAAYLRCDTRHMGGARVRMMMTWADGPCGWVR
jgi:hypothetical protein